MKYTFSSFSKARIATNDKLKTNDTFMNTSVFGEEASTKGVNILINGSTYDATHMDSFINGNANYKLSKQQLGDYAQKSRQLDNFILKPSSRTMLNAHNKQITVSKQKLARKKKNTTASSASSKSSSSSDKAAYFGVSSK